MHYVIKQDFVKENVTEELINEHVAYMHQLFETGKVIVSGPYLDEQKGGMFIVEVASKEEADSLAINDPATKAGALLNEIRPYNLAFKKE